MDSWVVPSRALCIHGCRHPTFQNTCPTNCPCLPIADDAVFHGIRDLEEGAHSSGFITDHDIFYFEIVETFFSAQDGMADNGGEDMFGEIGACVAELAISVRGI